jgi:hypothetical protein
LFTVLGGKFKFFAQDSDLEYLFWRSKNPPVSSDLKPPLGLNKENSNKLKKKPINFEAVTTCFVTEEESP